MQKCWHTFCIVDADEESARSGQYTSPIKKFIREGGEKKNMNTGIIISLGSLLLVVILAGLYYNSKNHTVDQICNHPELSDEKVKFIPGMMNRQYKNKKVD